MKIQNHHSNARGGVAVESLADFVGDTTSEPRRGLVQILRDLERGIVAPVGEKRYLYILRWKMPESFFAAKNGRLDWLWAYEGFEEKLKKHDIAGLWSDIAEHVKGAKKIAWRMIFCRAIFAALLEGNAEVQTKAAA